MSNIKVINWDVIRADYVMGTDYPSYDELSRRYPVSKPLIIAKANDVSDPINRGLTWMQQRENHISKKQSVQQDVANSEAKSAVKKFVKILNNIGMKAFILLDSDLDQLIKLQKDAKDAGKYFPVKNYIKVGDVAKIAEVLHRLSGNDSVKEMLLRLEVNPGGNKKALSDLSDKEIEVVAGQVKNGGAMIIDEEE